MFCAGFRNLSLKDLHSLVVALSLVQSPAVDSEHGTALWFDVVQDSSVLKFSFDVNFCQCFV